MVYKKYIKRDGKVFGPYYYESYRENGKIKTRFVSGPKKSDRIKGRVNLDKFKNIFLILLGVFLIFAVGSYFVKIGDKVIFSPDVSDYGTCVEKWICSDWEICVDGVQVRNCYDDNNCGSEDKKPIILRECFEEETVEEDKDSEILDKINEGIDCKDLTDCNFDYEFENVLEDSFKGFKIQECDIEGDLIRVEVPCEVDKKVEIVKEKNNVLEIYDEGEKVSELKLMKIGDDFLRLDVDFEFFSILCIVFEDSILLE